MTLSPRLPSPLPPSWRVDLHCHTDRSDGRHSAEDLLRAAVSGGVDVLAITDHDLPPAWPSGPVEIEGRPIWLLHAVELTGVWEGVEQHLLVYFPGEMPQDFRAFCHSRAQVRAARYDEAIRRLGLDGLPPADAAALAGERALTSFHLAQAMVQAGHVKTRAEAFTRLGKLMPIQDLPFAEGIRLGREAGGVAVWAHPELARAMAWTGKLAKVGLQGIEGLRPGLGKSVRNTLRTLSRKHGVFLAGGSDWHGWHPMRMGAFTLDAQQAAPFVAALGRG